MATIKNVFGRVVLNSRGEETIEVSIEGKSGVTKAMSPQGVSAGVHEAVSLPAHEALEKMHRVIMPEIVGKRFDTQQEFDNVLLSLDSTPEKSELGGNTMLALSVAHLRGEALADGDDLWRVIRKILGLSPIDHGNLRLFVNIIEGGLHAGNELPFQEFLAIPKASNLSEAASLARELYAGTKKLLIEKYGRMSINVGDEGGFAPPLSDPLLPHALLAEAAISIGREGEFDFGLDAAGSDVSLNHGDLQALYTTMQERFGLLYLEDPYGEEDFAEFAVLKKQLKGKTVVIGDDLTVTNPKRMEEAHKVESISGVIIKPNQIGTVSEALDAVRLARKYGWQVVASHRGGDTTDDFIADFAVGVMADGLKLGSPARGERVAKYNRLLEIEEREMS